MIADILFFIAMSFVWALWIMIPAYIPNPAAALIGGGTPIDFGRNAEDGRRLFGDGKTWRGFFGGILTGILCGLIQMQLAEIFGLEMLPQHTFVTVIALSVGSLTGDLVKSYFKRRLGKERGTKWPIADMYDMVAGSLILLLAALAATGTFAEFFMQFETVWFVLAVFIAIMILSPLLHRGTNIIGYLLGLKDVPW